MRTGEIDTAAGKSFGYVLQTATAALRVLVQEQRLAELEARLADIERNQK